MRRIPYRHLTTLGPGDLKAIGRFTGLSVYRGVIVFWDEDDDVRVLEMIDILDPWERCRLVAIHEHEGTVTLLWDSPDVPSQFKNGHDTSDGDYWSTENRLLGADMP